MAPEAHTAKGETDEVDFIRVQSVCASKGTIKKKAAHRNVKRHLPNNDLAANQGQVLFVSVFKFPPRLISV